MSIKINMKQVNLEAVIDEATTKKVEQIRRELLQQFKYELFAENATINLSNDAAGHLCLRSTNISDELKVNIEKYMEKYRI